MSPSEVAWRVREQVLRARWSRRRVRPDEPLTGPVPGLAGGKRRFASALPLAARELVPQAARTALIADADRILKGEWEMLGVLRADMEAPDWFFDPVTGRRSDPSRYAFRINQRSEEQVGNVKQVWELNRLQHLTLLAAAWYLTGEDVYAERVDAQLRDWWRANPFLSGVNWTSGIELGIRLINFAWIRRLLDSWPGAAGLFEGNDLAVRQIRWHQEYLAAFESRGSSANNHVIAEAAGQLAASCAFPWFRESSRWRESSLALLTSTLRSNTFRSGINAELATDYHGFVFELGAFGALEAAAAGSPVNDATWRLLCSMADCMAAVADCSGQPPRQGDSDEGRVVLLDAPRHNRWLALLSVAAELFGGLEWWPRTSPNVASALAAGLAARRLVVDGRPAARPSHFADAGITILRTAPEESPEIWVRCDGGPHGFGSIAAHAHADALSVEVRQGGTDVLADPGTYCYHGEPEWRSYFRSTIAHNTIEIGGRSQSVDSGPFMWGRQARTREIPDSAPALSWTAEHDGYAVLNPAVRHRRSVCLDPAAHTVGITDALVALGSGSPVRGPGAGHDLRMAFHLGPEVQAKLSGGTALLRWPGGAARFELSEALSWSLHRGQVNPVLGWYSASLGSRIPAFTLLGEGHCRVGKQMVSRLIFTEPEISVAEAR